jgi:16S rRNA (cytidine1402-2'-O)-methyltransferase
MTGILYVIATPIGNLDDITRRAASTLCATATIACEDTRRTRVLLDHLGARPERLISYHEHVEAQVAERLLGYLRAGEDVALVTDAGTPLLSDPGFELLRRAAEAGIRCVPLPGPSALMAALAVCPLPAANRFCFAGFLPVKERAREVALTTCLAGTAATVVFEAPHRLAATLAALDALAPTRQLFVARELTKRYESFYRGTAAEIAAALRAGDAYRGEFVVVIAGASARPPAGDARQIVKLLCDELPPARAAKVAAALTGESRQALYRLALELTGA